MPRAKYPEHAKLRRQMAKRDSVVEFYDFLTQGEGYIFSRRHAHDAACEDDYGIRVCGLHSGDLMFDSPDPSTLIGKFLGVDRVRLEEEKRAILAEIRRRQASRKAARS